MTMNIPSDGGAAVAAVQVAQPAVLSAASAVLSRRQKPLAPTRGMLLVRVEEDPALFVDVPYRGALEELRKLPAVVLESDKSAKLAPKLLLM